MAQLVEGIAILLRGLTCPVTIHVATSRTMGGQDSKGKSHGSAKAGPGETLQGEQLTRRDWTRPIEVVT